MGRRRQLPGLRADVWTRVWTRLGSLGQRGGAVGIKVSAIWRFNPCVDACFVERIRAPGRPGEPQSTDGEQRCYCQGETLRFHEFLLFVQNLGFITFDTAWCAELQELAFGLG
jgi:hypothetical protein